jgi:uncharacterized protein HemX
MNIDQLLEKYWEGETTLEEERALKHYFSGENIEARFQYAVPFFKALRAEQSVVMQTPPIALRVVKKPTPWIRWAAAAALLGILSLTGWHAVQQYRQEKEMAAIQQKLNTDTFETPEQAAAEIKAALALVSSKLNKGKRQMNKGLKKMEQMDKYIPKPGI